MTEPSPEWPQRQAAPGNPLAPREPRSSSSSTLSPSGELNRRLQGHSSSQHATGARGKGTLGGAGRPTPFSASPLPPRAGSVRAGTSISTGRDPRGHTRRFCRNHSRKDLPGSSAGPKQGRLPTAAHETAAAPSHRPPGRGRPRAGPLRQGHGGRGR
ncbi:hypothetical protein H8959_007160 [Pygathrix nigripes]